MSKQGTTFPLLLIFFVLRSYIYILFAFQEFFFLVPVLYFFSDIFVFLLPIPLMSTRSYFFGMTLLIEEDVSVTLFSQTTFTTVSEWLDMEAKSRSRTRWWTAARALGAVGKIRAHNLAALRVAARGQRSCRLRSRAHLGSYSCSWRVVSHKNLLFWLVCTCSVLEVNLFCKLTELRAFLCTSSGILWHILVVLLAWSSTQS